MSLIRKKISEMVNASDDSLMSCWEKQTGLRFLSSTFQWQSYACMNRTQFYSSTFLKNSWHACTLPKGHGGHHRVHSINGDLQPEPR